MSAPMPPLPPTLTVHPITRFDQTLCLPGSKSLSNRALLLAALADGPSAVDGVLEADDTRRMIEALRRLGFHLDQNRTRTSGMTVYVRGMAGQIPRKDATLDLGNAGTAIRPLTAACCLGLGVYRLDGNPRMRQRPIGELAVALRQLGATISCPLNEGYPPIDVRAQGMVGGRLTMKPTLSSQFITALLMCAPYMRDGLRIDFDGPITSRPYVELTIGLMRRFGVNAHVETDWSSITVDPGKYQAVDYLVEPDASNATYFLAAAAAIPGSRCTIPGLSKASLQGDAAFVDLLADMGAQVQWEDESVSVASPPNGQRLHGLDVDLNHMPDAAMTLAAIAPVAAGPTTIRNVGNWRVKETDRMTALKTELEKVGPTVEISDHGQGNNITITPPPNHRLRSPASGLETYDDHRMAMALATLALIAGPLPINDPTCVNKTFPAFWDVLGQLEAKLE